MAEGRQVTVALFAFISCLVIHQTTSDLQQIHRALPGANGKPSYRLANTPTINSADASRDKIRDRPSAQSFSSQTKMDNESEWTQAVVYSVVSSILVGLSGIFPLLVVPLDAGPSLKHGAGSVLLKLLLSFAVGSLLGDVFLHLLPEAWATVCRSEDPHWEHTKIGLLVIAGMLGFLILERIFDNGEEDETEEQTEEVTEDISEKRDVVHTNGSLINNNGTNNLRSRNNGVTNGHVANGHVTNGHGSVVDESEKSAVQNKPSQIKITGYLNLLANCVDNFTHGLAVAGSYLISPKVGMCTTIAILLHEVPHEIGDFAILLRSGFDRWRAAKAQILTASGGVLGALTALFAESAESAGDRTAWILPFTAGGFIYIALVTVTPDLLKETSPRESLKQIICLIAGILSMLLVTIMFE